MAAAAINAPYIADDAGPTETDLLTKLQGWLCYRHHE
jgi:hypothetical protein